MSKPLQQETLVKQATELSFARYNNEPNQNNDLLQALQTKLTTPSIGGFVAVGTASTEESDTLEFIGIFQTKDLAQRAVDKFGSLPLAQELNQGFSTMHHSAHVVPVTKALAEIIKKNEEWSPDFMYEMTCKINGEKVPSAPFEDGMEIQAPFARSALKRSQSFKP